MNQPSMERKRGYRLGRVMSKPPSYIFLGNTSRDSWWNICCMSEWLFWQARSCGKGKSLSYFTNFGEEKIKCWHVTFLLQDLIDEGHAATQLVNQLHDVVVENDALSDKQKSIITEKLAVSRHLCTFQQNTIPKRDNYLTFYFSCRM